MKDSEFEYSLTFDGGVKEKYTAQKYTGADKEGDEFTVKSRDTFKLKDNQTLKIYGVDGGTKYTVTEANRSISPEALHSGMSVKAARPERTTTAEYMQREPLPARMPQW